MTRFIFISDTHYGAILGKGFEQQKRYANNIGEIIYKLNDWIRNDSKIDFVLHGGDIVDYPSKKAIFKVSKLFNELSVPVYFCLGNHDLSKKNALELWNSYALEFFPEGKINYTISTNDVTIHVMPNQWSDYPYYWNGEAFPHFSREQLGMIDNSMYQKDEKNIHILCTHCGVMGIPIEQTGFDTIVHSPPELFYNEVKDIIRQNSSFRCVLSGHNHVNTNVIDNGIHYITTSALIEVPFEFKLIEANFFKLKISTISLANNLNFKFKYDYDRTYVQGRKKDRNIEIL